MLEALAEDEGMDEYDLRVVQTALQVQEEAIALEEAAALVLVQISDEDYDAAAAAGTDEAAVDKGWERG